MVETSTGVGIGTTSPQTKLHSSGTTNGAQATFGGSDSGLKISTFQKTDNDAGVTLDAQQSSNGTLTFATAGTERARFDSSGRLLVGTTGSSTNDTLVLQGNSAGSTFGANLRLRRNATISSGSGIGEIAFEDSSGNQYAAIAGQGDGTSGSNDYPGRLTFWTTADGASGITERMRIESGGAVLIGNGIIGDSSNGEGILFTDGGFIRLGNITGSGSASMAQFKTGSGSTEVLRFRCDGDLENQNNRYGAISDANLKENIVDAGSQWDDIKKHPCKKI